MSAVLIDKAEALAAIDRIIGFFRGGGEYEGDPEEDARMVKEVLENGE